MTLTFLSLFAGIGGLDLGLERAGLQCVGQVEIDEYATRVLTKHWPNVPRWRDVRECGRHNLPDCDLICGGFPCQDISNAGKRAGIEGERSGLWSEYARIVGELRPRYVLVENVAALLGRGLGRVLGDLAEIGYDAEWHCIPAAAVGAPHIRDRVFICAYANSTADERIAGGLFAAQETQARGQRKRLGRMGKAVAVTNSPPLVWITEPRAECNPWTVEPDVGRVAHGVPARVDRLRGLGNAVVPQVAEYIGRMIVAADRAREAA